MALTSTGGRNILGGWALEQQVLASVGGLDRRQMVSYEVPLGLSIVGV